MVLPVIVRFKKILIVMGSHSKFVLVSDMI